MKHIDRPDFLDAPIIQPELASLAAPKPGIKPDGPKLRLLKSIVDFPPVRSCRRHVKFARRQFAVAVCQHFDVKRVRRLQPFGLDPKRQPVTAMRLDMDGLHHAAVAILVGGEILQPDRRAAAVFDFGIGKTDFARLIVKIVAFECVAVEILKPAVFELDRICRRQVRLVALDQKRRIITGSPSARFGS